MPGGLAVAGEFPNMCTLYLLYEGFNVFTGGASLISSNQVLTLASGVSKYRGFQQESIGEDDLDLRGANKESCGDTTGVKFDLFVSCGGINLQPNEADPNKQTRKVKSILIHPEFNPKSLTNDMAVLVVDSPFEMTEFVGPACLPEPSFDPKVLLIFTVFIFFIFPYIRTLSVLQLAMAKIFMENMDTIPKIYRELLNLIFGPKKIVKQHSTQNISRRITH